MIFFHQDPEMAPPFVSDALDRMTKRLYADAQLRQCRAALLAAAERVHEYQAGQLLGYVLFRVLASQLPVDLWGFRVAPGDVTLNPGSILGANGDAAEMDCIALASFTHTHAATGRLFHGHAS
jgi:hypothetical protein